MKPTFEKLSTQKKTIFLESAFQEFALYDYAQANIGRIAQSAQIAKGSVYQYFEDKKSLYFYLIQQAQQKKQQAISHIFQEKNDDFFNLFEKINQQNLLFDEQNPVLQKFLYNVSQERHNEELGNLHEKTLKQSTLFFQKMIAQQQAKNLIDTNIDAQTLAFFVVNHSAGIAEFLKIFPNENPQIFLKKWLTLFEKALCIS